MDQARLQFLTARGYSKAAQRIGAQTVQYRPAALSAPMTAPYASFLAAFNMDAAFSFKQPTPWGKPMVFGLFDTTDVQAGDILVCGTSTYFVARFEPFEPPICVLCNNAVVVSPGTSGSDGSPVPHTDACALAGLESGYSGMPDAGAGTVAALTGAWPCYLGLRGTGANASSGLPSSVKAAEFLLMLPVMPGFAPVPYMTFSDQSGIGYTISAVERSSYGFRCVASVQQL